MLARRVTFPTSMPADRPPTRSRDPGLTPTAPFPTAGVASLADPHTERPLDRRPLRFELALVFLVSLAVLAPGIWSYSLVDPWETHYGEVARTMLQDNDFVHTNWIGTSSGTPGDIEGFRSKPVLTFWMGALGMRAVGVADHGGYSGEMVSTVRVMLGLRLPFVLSAIFGLMLMWWMLARLVNRRLAWLALLVVGSTPMYCLVARQEIPDMPMVACTIGSIALFILAVEDGERPIRTRALWRGNRVGGWARTLHYDARHVVLGLSCGFVLLQALYYAIYFVLSPQLAIRGPIPSPAIWLPGIMLLMLAGLSRDGWLIFRLPMVLIGGVIAAIVNEPMPRKRRGQSTWRHIFDDILTPWDRHALDRYIIRGLVMPFVLSWRATAGVADRALRIQPITTMRQLYLLGCYFLLGISLLAKGPPGVTVVGLVGVFYVICFWRWRALYEGAFEIKRGLLLASVVAIPWHVGMWLKEGLRFVDEYFYTHILNRAGSGVDNSTGTFEYYFNQIGHGMWLWAALLPAAIAAAFLRSDRTTREGRVRFVISLWAILGTALFCLVQTKFHHYILPAIPALGVLVAWYLDDCLSRRQPIHWLYAMLGAGIVLLIARDLMFEPERWIEMFVFRYDRPWPSADPWSIDPSDGFLGLGMFAAIALIVASTRYVRFGVTMICAAGLAICIWALQVYMPLAGTHWGMRHAARTYYERRTVYGEKLIYFGGAEFYRAWSNASFVRHFDTFIPDNLQLGQPMTVTIQIRKAEDERVIQDTVVLNGTATAIGDHTVEVTIDPKEHAKLAPLLAKTAHAKAGRRPPIEAVDADRLIAWQLYWRGENFWSGGEIWRWQPDMQTSFVNPNNVEMKKYLNDRSRSPLGRHYFVITEAGRINSVRSLLPTPHARDTYEVLDTTSNKFSLGWFEL